MMVSANDRQASSLYEGRALSRHKTAQAYRGYAKETMKRTLAAPRKRHA
jgi:hypothetical protein